MLLQQFTSSNKPIISTQYRLENLQAHQYKKFYCVFRLGTETSTGAQGPAGAEITEVSATGSDVSCVGGADLVFSTSPAAEVLLGTLVSPVLNKSLFALDLLLVASTPIILDAAINKDVPTARTGGRTSTP